jgi:hypothetical protein
MGFIKDYVVYFLHTSLHLNDVYSLALLHLLLLLVSLPRLA